MKPILLYGSEIWGHGNLDVIERVQLKFLKHILSLKKSTSNCIVYGETGVFPIYIDIYNRCINYWAKIASQDNNKISFCVYSCLKNKYIGVQTPSVRKINFAWIHNIQTILISCGLSGIWQSHIFPNQKWLSHSVKQKLVDLFLNDWYSSVENTSSCITYRLFKKEFKFEKYLMYTPTNLLKCIVKIRTRNHKLPIETGRWNGTQRADRTCQLCILSIGDEYHYLLECKSFSDYRNKYINEKYTSRPNVIKFESLMNLQAGGEYYKLCKFIKIILNHFSE